MGAKSELTFEKLISIRDTFIKNEEENDGFIYLSHKDLRNLRRRKTSIKSLLNKEIKRWTP
jgi:hypothetical protein